MMKGLYEITYELHKLFKNVKQSPILENNINDQKGLI